VRIFRVPSIRTLFITLLVASTVGLNLGPVTAMTVTNYSMGCPSKARVGDTLDVGFSGSYDTDVKILLHVELKQQSDNQHIGASSWEVEHLAPAGVPVHGQFGFTIEAQAPTPPSWSGDQYEWILEGYLSDLLTQTSLGTAQCSITIIKADADPSVRITRASMRIPHNPIARCGTEGDMNDIYVGEACVIDVGYDYSAPVGSNYGLRYQNSRGIYSRDDSPGDDGWVEQTLYPGSTVGLNTTSSSGSAAVYVSVGAPLDPTSSWLWQIEINVTAPDGRKASDTASLNLTVLDRNWNWAAFRDTTYPPSMIPNTSGQVILTGVYVFPAGNSGTLTIGIVDLTSCQTGLPNPPPCTPPPVAGGENQTIGPYSGSGTFSQTFTITPAEPRGRVSLWAGIWVSDIPYYLDYRSINIDLGGSVCECNITSVEVNGGPPPEAIRHGEPFRVDVDLSWTFPNMIDASIRAEIWDWDRIVQVIGTNDLTIPCDFCDGASSGVISVQVPADAIPTRDGDWPLRAIIYGSAWTGSGEEDCPRDSRVFNVTLGAGPPSASTTSSTTTSPPAGGRFSDWAVTQSSISPVQPFLGTDVTFMAKIVVTTSDPLPQTVTVSYSLDGGEPVKDSVTYQSGLSFLQVSSQTWTPTLGEHTISWAVDPDQQYSDPNRANNVMSSRFIVAEIPPQPPLPPPPPPASEEFDFYVTATPTEQTTHSLVTYRVTVNATAGSPKPVQLDLVGAPAGASYFFGPPSGIPDYFSTLTITTPTSLPAGTYTLTINASSVGKARYKTLFLNVEKGPTYTLSLTPRTVQAKPGDKAEFKVTLSSDSGYDQFVNLVASGLPVGATSQFQPNAAIPTSQSTLLVELGKDVAPGFYTITVIGSGPKGKRATAILQVRGEMEAIQSRETTVNYLAAAILGLIIATVVVAAVLVVRRLKTRQPRMFCIECGAKLRAGLQYCPKCGADQRAQS